MKLMMRMCGFSHIVAATNGAEAIEHLKEWRFDIILSDWNMTPMDGLDLLRALRAMPGVGNTPFVLLTASLSETAWRGAIDLGATDFLLKPIQLNELRTSCSLCRDAIEYDGNVIPLSTRLRARRFNVG
ncbi:MAG: response regulator [Hyphomicrobiales bacterium]|nr:response regulator [Hyphomicrobiales bacterium]